jgi:hypothetical protein
LLLIQGKRLQHNYAQNSLAAILLKTCDFFYQIFISPSQPGTLNALIKATLPFGLHASQKVTIKYVMGLRAERHPSQDTNSIVSPFLRTTVTSTKVPVLHTLQQLQLIQKTNS